MSNSTKRAALALSLGLACALVIATAPTADAKRKQVQTVNLGPGVTDLSLSGGKLVGDKLYAVSRNATPLTIGVYDTQTRAVVDTIALPNQSAAAVGWGVDAVGTDLYVGSQRFTGDTNLYRVDTLTGQVTGIALEGIGPQSVDASEDGHVFAGGRPNAVGDDRGGYVEFPHPPDIYEYDPDTGAIRNLGAPDPDARSVSSVAASLTTVYVGSNGPSKFNAIDRVSGAIQRIVVPELANASDVRRLEVNEDWVIAAINGGGGARLLVMNQRDWSDYTIVQPNAGGVMDAITLEGSTAYFATNAGTFSYDIRSKSLDRLTGNLGDKELALRNDGLLVGLGGDAVVRTFNPQTGVVERTDLVEAGFARLPETAQSIMAGGGRVFVAGHSRIGVRSTSDGTPLADLNGGESKAMAYHDNHLWATRYPNGTLWEYSLPAGTSREVDKFPAGQTRPVVAHHDPGSGKVLAGTHANSTGAGALVGGGALIIYNPADGTSIDLVDPFGPDEGVTAITSAAGVVYAGGAVTGPSLSDGKGPTVAAYDPSTGAELWQVNPSPDGERVTGLAVKGRYLYGLTGSSEIFILDLKTRAVVHVVPIAIEGNLGQLKVHRDQIYAISSEQLIGFDPRRRTSYVVLDDLHSSWQPAPQFAIDEDGSFYVLQGKDVLRVDGVHRARPR